MAEKILKEIFKSDVKKIVISTTTLYDKKFFQIKEMWRANETDEWKYCKKVVTMGYKPTQEFLEFFTPENQEKITLEMSKK